MTYIELIALARDQGFQGRVQIGMFNVVKDKAPAATGDDLTYLNSILRGDASVFQMTIGVLLNGAVANAGNEATSASDGQIKTAVEQVWPFYAAAGVTLPGGGP